MGFAELFLIAVGLSMDAFAVSICKGLSLRQLKPRHAVLVGLYFGGFQFLMPVIGWALGYRFEHIIESIDHWIAFGLLTVIGIGMIREAGQADELNDDLSFKTMLPLAVATSIDALAVGVTAPFYLTKLLAPHFNPGAAVVNLASSRDRMSQPQTESYTAAKGGIAALTHAMAISLAGKARVNSISPGWIDTTGSVITGSDAAQQPVGRVGKPEDIAEMALFLCSDKAGFITGENICIDGGMTRLMIYHGEHGWCYAE